MDNHLIHRITPFFIALGELSVAAVSAYGISSITGFGFWGVFLVTSMLAFSRFFGVLVIGNSWRRIRSRIGQGLSSLVLFYCFLTLLIEGWGVYSVVSQSIYKVPDQAQALQARVDDLENSIELLEGQFQTPSQYRTEFLIYQAQQENQRIRSEIGERTLLLDNVSVELLDLQKHFGFVITLGDSGFLRWSLGLFCFFFASIFTTINILNTYYGLTKITAKPGRKSLAEKMRNIYG